MSELVSEVYDKLFLSQRKELIQASLKYIYIQVYLEMVLRQANSLSLKEARKATL